MAAGLGWLSFWVFLLIVTRKTQMIYSFRSTDATPASSLPMALVQPACRDADTPQPIPPVPEPTPIRHLLIGTPEVVQHTIHRLHNLRYAEAGFWSPVIHAPHRQANALPESQLIVSLNPNEIMRILVRSLRVMG